MPAECNDAISLPRISFALHCRSRRVWYGGKRHAYATADHNDLLLFGNSSAPGVEVDRQIEAPGVPAQIWEIAGDFCAIKAWHPLVADCKQTNEGDAVLRTLTAKNGATIKEKLVASDDRSYSYEIIESPLPVKNYNAKLWIEESERPNRTVIHWDAKIDANGASDDEAKKQINDFFPRA